MSSLEAFAIGEPISTPSLESYSREQLQAMAEAAREALECQRVLKKVGLNLVGEILKGQGKFVQFNHYPDGDVYDRDTGSQYYYHAHREGEHGHFHLFNRPARDNQQGKVKTPTHLIAISMDPWGLPIGLFTTNRWVTGEKWRRADKTLALADAFEIDHAWPSWPVNRWVTAMLRCYRPYLEVLLAHRDREIERLQASQDDVFENRDVEVIGQLPIDLPNWSKQLEETLSRRAA
ncbi:hypothetical protein GCM10007160_12400 [Litchfieldella qijiaojingensis]|uniref:DUF6969 domain-containing protein n=1 Tax=Litchfieldella qijiaojingensis TaxID=980347 RepID=A0ABQ2YJM8_9GAMM|nr:hypothetical protein [Halomonas qijiaojingensis]GGX86580.1 hypothetical protein GCM10007160_12400 [Halomonas qijiaojingensis]